MAKTGRPTKLTPEASAKLCKAMSTGCLEGDAAAAAGIDRGTLSRWLKRGRAEGAREPYKAFAEAFDNAAKVAKVGLLAVIHGAVRGEKGEKGWVREPSWKAAAWLLERRYPEEYGRRDRLQLTGAGGDAAPVRVDVQALLVDVEAQAAADLLLSKLGGAPAKAST